MVKMHKVGMAAVLVGLMASAGTVQAQEYNGSTGAAPVQTTTTNSTSTATTGDSTVAPFQNTTTTTQAQTVNSTTAATTTAVTKTIGTNTYGGSITVSGTGSQGQTTATSITTTYNPGPPPTVVGTSAPATVVTPVGTATVTAVSASGSVGLLGATPLYSSALSSSGAVTNGSVVATEDSVTVTSSGVSFERRVGTATYNPTAGTVTVALPTAATSATSISATGISTGALTSTSLTTGAISATGLNMNGNKITNVAAGTASTDAVNLGQLNAAVATLTGSYNTFAASVNANLLRYRKLAQAGTAVAVAMSGGTFLPDKKINLTVNFGHFEGESAMSGQLGFLVSPNFALNAGVATSFTSGGGTAVRVGGTFGF
jgi:hypothetical protein